MRTLAFISLLIFASSLHAQTFLNLQWGLKNTGSPQTIELDHVTNYKVQARAGDDINLPPSIRALRPITVAVLDTGVDVTHPSLQNMIKRNESECQALEKYKACLAEKDAKTCDAIWMNLKNPEVDQDRNGYPLDCNGWTILGNVNAVSGIRGGPEFKDDQGHGTHVAGIIGAHGGILGVSQNVRLLPVQVLGQKPVEPLKPLSLVDITPQEKGKEAFLTSLGDIVARGLNYAIASGAEVVNFSLGWPQGQDSKYLRDVIAEAQRRGVFVVAAAGNDSTRALLRPCAYPGVICVASHGPDGSLSHFSNYGSGVDIAAPGTNILSTYPMENRPVRFRNTQGFEFLHGTSQAAPFVSGMIAEMLARGVPKDEIYPRLLLGTRPLQKNLPLLTGTTNQMTSVQEAEASGVEPRFILSGLADLDRALKVQPQPLILPISKEKIEKEWNRTDREIQISFPFQNLWKEVALSKVNLKLSWWQPDSRSVRPKIKSYNLVSASGAKALPQSWKQGETLHLQVSLEMVDSEDPSASKIPSELDFLLEIQADNQQSRKIVLESEITIPIGKDVTVLKTDLNISLDLKDRVGFLLVDDRFDQDKRFDYLGRLESAPGQIEYLLIRQSENKSDAAYGEKGRFKISVAEEDLENMREQVIARLPQGYALGLYFDRSQIKDADSTLDLYILQPDLKRKEKLQITTKKNQIPTRIYWQNIGGILRPTWQGLGFDPDKKPSLRDMWESDGQPEVPEFRLYYFDNAGKLKALQKYQDHFITDILEPTQDQKLRGVVPVLMAKNSGTENKPSYVYEFIVAEAANGKFTNVKPLALAEGQFYRNLLDTRVGPVMSLTNEPGVYSGTFWFGEGSPKSQRTTLLLQKPNQNKVLENNIRAERGVVDSTLWVRAAFYSPERAGAFALTNSELQYVDLQSGKTVSRSLEKYTFWADYTFVALQFPMTLKDLNNPRVKIPALYNVEGSGLSKGLKIRMPVFDSKTGDLIELISPAKLRFKSAAGCRPLDFPLMDEEGTKFDYFCGNRILRLPLTF